MRAPAFWWQAAPSPFAHLLRPVSLIYGAVAGRRMGRRGIQAELPVICIGNFTAGGAGKTPTALAVADLLEAAGESPTFLSRGYGGRLPGPVEVTRHHTAGDIGDEPLLLARRARTIVSRDRPAGTRLAVEIGATAVVMDDGLQNPSLRKDCAIAVVDGATGIGNGLSLPSGPLRAPLSAQWKAIHAVLVIGGGTAGEAVAREAERYGKRTFFGHLVPDPAVAESLRGKRVLAFAGIGRPEKFFATLRECGAVVERMHAFADHHPFSAADLDGLSNEARNAGLQPVTTEKDLARIAGADLTGHWPDLVALPVRLRLDDEAAFRNFLLRHVEERRISAMSL